MSEVELGGATVFPQLGARIPPTYVRLTSSMVACSLIPRFPDLYNTSKKPGDEAR